MLIVIPQVLPREEALALGRELAAAAWVDGNVTSGEGAALAKRNRQLPEEGEAAARGRAIVQRALARNPLFLSAALPYQLFPPLFNRYGPGEFFGDHVDNAVRLDRATGRQLRIDLSATLFLSEDYEGGELTIESGFGKVAHKLPAGDMVLYPSSSLHRVTQVTSGERISCFFWLQSLVRDHAGREALFDLDQAIQRLSVDRGGDDSEVLRLTKAYHNLVRMWAL
ncbi:MAG TPA: Fe2+-dependent dioxygenase [Novosphingobium sp.]|nr:Fe2+-dependent dioxygenase [Novosphingobium sp.]HZV08826.1 Fe2+-dependent dioxygenase [Novosphingobium sp.]